LGECFPKGLTAIDDLTQAVLGSRPTMSHATAQFEVQGLLRQILGRQSAGSKLNDREMTAVENAEVVSDRKHAEAWIRRWPPVRAFTAFISTLSGSFIMELRRR
jgi:hypothetical protein